MVLGLLVTSFPPSHLFIFSHHLSLHFFTSSFFSLVFFIKSFLMAHGNMPYTAFKVIIYSTPWEACLFVTEVGFAMLDSISVQFDCMSCMYFACFGVCSSEIYHKIKLEIIFHTRRFR